MSSIVAPISPKPHRLPAEPPPKKVFKANRDNLRDRTPVACNACRARRAKCRTIGVRPRCENCHRNNLDCVVLSDGRQTRPISKPNLNALTERLELLEGCLNQTGQLLSSSTRSNNAPSRSVGDSENVNLDTPTGQHDRKRDRITYQGPVTPRNPTESDRNGIEICKVNTPKSKPSSKAAASSSPFFNKLISRPGLMTLDRESGKYRYFGPTSDFNFMFEQEVLSKNSRQNCHGTSRILRNLATETQEYLMGLFWSQYNSVIHVVDADAFNEGREARTGPFYTSYLHLCILAMGYRYADKSRRDISQLTLRNRESTLHEELICTFEHELEEPCGLPLVQALLILADIECAVGRDSTGWMFQSMACRFCFDIGLNITKRPLDMSEREARNRKMVLCACLAYDKFWALFLGRPPSIKSSDISRYPVTKPFHHLPEDLSNLNQSRDCQIYEAFFDLMALLDTVGGPLTVNVQNADLDAYVRAVALDNDLRGWYEALLPPLRWNPINSSERPFSYFLLHQQYHAIQILVHRPFALYDESRSTCSEALNSKPNSHYTLLARRICFSSALSIGRMIDQSQERFPIEHTFITTLQHIGTAVTVLIGEISFSNDARERKEALKILGILSKALADMSMSYKIAERMTRVLNKVTDETGFELPGVTI